MCNLLPSVAKGASPEGNCNSDYTTNKINNASSANE